MTQTLDLNADIGELTDVHGRSHERAILEFVSSCNIACGGHAGDVTTMRDRIICARDKGVIIGAHPGYPDRENFGRKSLQLGIDITEATLRESIISQIKTLIDIARSEDATIRYVKPHGTLYTDSAKDHYLANLITQCIYEIDPNLGIMGFPNSELERAAKAKALAFISEGFIDRLYAPDGHLTPRSHPRAVIADLDARLAQALSLALDNIAHDNDGLPVTVSAQSLCLHGDSAGALETAQLARETLQSAGLTIASPYAA